MIYNIRYNVFIRRIYVTLCDLVKTLETDEFLYLHFNSIDNKNLSELIEEYYNKSILKVKRDIDGIHVYFEVKDDNCNWFKQWTV